MWFQAPEAGFLPTPSDWCCRGGGYFVKESRQGAIAGNYAGINYGFGY